MAQVELLVDLLLVQCGVQVLQLMQLQRIARDLRRLPNRTAVVMCPARAIAACRPDADA